MRIALIQVPLEDFYTTPQRSYPLGLTYLAAAIEDLQVNVEIVDLITGFGRQMVQIPKNFKPIIKYLPYDRSPISAFHSYYHFGASWEKVENYFNENNYDLYAISSNFYTYSQEVIKTAEIIKKTNPHAIVLVGGQNVGPEHSLFTDCLNIDHCLQGEGDLAFREFVKALSNGEDLSDIPGFFNRSTDSWNKAVSLPDFDRKPSAERLSAEKYTIARDAAMMISSSRGCPMGCRFCSVSHTFGKKLRLKPSNIIIEEIQSAYSRGIRAFDIEDDNFTFKREHCIDLLSKVSKNLSGKVKLYAMNGLSAEHLDEEIIDLLLNAGMTLLNLSIATSSEEQLEKLHRNTNIQKFKQISRYAASKGMKVMGHFIAGLPGQSDKEVLNTMQVLSELPLVLGISPFYYIPGMNMQVPHLPENCKNARLSRFWPADDQLNELDLITLFRLSRWINYLKNQMSLKKITSIAFNNISCQFPDDHYLYNFVQDKIILGLNNKNEFYEHKTSQRIFDRFFEIFKDSDVYCA